MQQIAALEAAVGEWREVAAKITDAGELLDLAQGEDDGVMMEELAAESVQLQARLADMRLRTLMSGPHDARDAILSIYAREGGTESQDWTSMLLRMYLRWAERRGYRAEILDEMEGEEAGLKSVTVAINGRNAYGSLRSERGVHRLVRISPFDNAHRRHTSFALIEVVPDVGDAIQIATNPDDIKMDVYHSGGHGGQNVQKTSTAVRLTHIPRFTR